MEGQTEPGLVAFCNIQPGNRAGLFLQPRNPYGAKKYKIIKIMHIQIWSFHRSCELMAILDIHIKL